ncbi:MAG: hypothetical protein Q7U04_18205 [Bacteriovorax sp.]|nr:hypothetical protein [Bacteriovorax sp.]
MQFILIFFTYILNLNVSSAAYYDTLPKGVRNFTYRFIQTGEITGSYGNSGNFKGYNVNANINADSIKGVNSAVDVYLNSLSASDYANFSFGTFQGSATSKVSAQAFGLGYGLTDRLTVYGFVPFYSAQVDLKIERTAKGRNNVGTAIQLENLPDVDVRLIQSLFVNYYHYQPLGKWQAKAFGDTELGMMYQLQKWKNAGALINLGAVSPTGRKDNPDILQDISFGDGQWDAFFEWGGGFNFTKNWSIDNWSRVTYQFPYSANVRLPESTTFPITANSGMAKIKLGNKIQTNVQGSYKLSDEWNTSLIYSLEYTEPTVYKSSSAQADLILATDTEKITHTGVLNLGYTTVGLYKQKKFFAPISLNFSVQSIFAGKNVPKYQRADFDIRFFF